MLFSVFSRFLNRLLSIMMTSRTSSASRSSKSSMVRACASLCCCHVMLLFVSIRHLSLTQRLNLLSCCCIIIIIICNGISAPVHRENGLLHVPHTDASRDGSLPRSAWTSRKRRFAGASWYPRCTRNAWTVGQTGSTRRPRTPR